LYISLQLVFAKAVANLSLLDLEKILVIGLSLT